MAKNKKKGTRDVYPVKSVNMKPSQEASHAKEQVPVTNKTNVTKKRKKAMKLPPFDDNCLRWLYSHFDIPSDQYVYRPDMLKALTESFNEVTGRNETPTDVLHYIVCKRKQTKWIKLGRKKRSGLISDFDFLSQEDELTLGRIYSKIASQAQQGSDSFIFDAGLASELHSEFSKATKKAIPAGLLLAVLMKYRKAGRLPKLDPPPRDDSDWFNDFDAVSV